jgi:UDP-N-acetylglucosamine diphosphorylase / glucose-1-phosphate thymidylyltransferase / UDP-N-acetylgalactosamine diphosphorylase / glucosamine-1-phosphate N-acetyltransferase / galactosamine-1-phosphate N-acetyltransferase
VPLDHLVVMAAGRGTRMDPLTRTRPKVLLPVAGRPLMEHLLLAGKEAGFRRFTLVVHEGQDHVRARYAQGFQGLPVAFVDQGKPQGTGHAVASLAGHVDGAFVLASGDSFLSAADLAKLRGAPGNAVAGRNMADARAYGLLSIEGGKVMGILEKPASGGGAVNAGAYRFEADVVERCRRLKPSPRGELELTDAVTALAKDGHAAAYVETASWMEAGRPWDLLDLQAHLMAGLKTRIDGDVGDRVDLVGPVVVEAGAKVLNGCRIEGPVWIGADAKVGPNAYLRPSTALGAKTHIGGSVEVKNSIVGDGSNVPHLSYVGDSVIGSGCNLGAGTQVANLKVSDRNVRVHWKGKDWIDTGRRKLGVIVGDDVKVGVNCSLNPGTVLCSGVRAGAGQVLDGWVEPDAR